MAGKEKASKINDYTSKGSFNSAFKYAREQKDSEFIWNGKRYNTKLISDDASEDYFKAKRYVEQKVSELDKKDRELGNQNLNKPTYFSITNSNYNEGILGLYDPQNSKLFIGNQKDKNDRIYISLHELAHKAGLHVKHDQVDFDTLYQRNKTKPTLDLVYKLNRSERAARHLATQYFFDQKGIDISKLPDDMVAEYLRIHEKELPPDTKDLVDLYGREGVNRQLKQRLEVPLSYSKGGYMKTKRAYGLGGTIQLVGAGLSAVNPILGGIASLAGNLISGNELARQQQKLIDDQTMANFRENSQKSIYNYYHQPGMAKGGYLEPISKDAVEVIANDPSKTDSVELPTAFVDNDEIISNNRVFSDDLKSGGISFSKRAKKLEKMKSTNPRFTQANRLIDSKLDALFEEQESLKDGGKLPGYNYGGKLSYAKGGIYIKPSKRGTFTAAAKKHGAGVQEFAERVLSNKENYSTAMVKKANFARNAAKWKHQNGGILDELTVTGDRIPGFRPNPIGDLSNAFNTTRSAYDKFHTEIFNLDQTPQSAFSFQPEGERQFLSTPQLRRIGVGASAFIPNIANAILQRGLKGPQAPQMENKVSLQRVTPDAALAANTRDFRGAQKLLTSNTAQGSNLASSIGSILGRRFASTNQIIGDTQRTNASIQQQEAGINAGIGARNTERLNQYAADQINFSNRKKMMTSANIGSVSSKIQQMGQEANQKELDLAKLDLIKKQFEESGVFNRAMKKIFEDFLAKQLGG
jgi:hypothetical protein